LIDGRKSLMNMALESKEISDRLFSPKRIAKSWDYFLYNLK